MIRFELLNSEHTCHTNLSFMLHSGSFVCRRELQVRLEQIILLDPDLANKQNTEQMLWKSVFYHMVEMIRKQKDGDQDDETKFRLVKILEEVRH